jgi:hypothetical protein
MDVDSSGVDAMNEKKLRMRSTTPRLCRKRSSCHLSPLSSARIAPLIFGLISEVME